MGVMKAAPRYSQIISYYQSLIESGKLTEGEKIPTEEAIGELFGVSRITVRQALDGLAQGGYIYKIQGKGSFVSAKKAGMQLNHLVGFSDEMRRHIWKKALPAHMLRPLSTGSTARPSVPLSGWTLPRRYT